MPMPQSQTQTTLPAVKGVVYHLVYTKEHIVTGAFLSVKDEKHHVIKDSIKYLIYSSPNKLKASLL